MTARVNVGEIPDVDVGVNLGRVEAGVSEHFLHIADVRAAQVHRGCTGMTERADTMTVNRLASADGGSGYRRIKFVGTGLRLDQPALACSARKPSAISTTLACCLRGSLSTASNTWRARPAGAEGGRLADSLPTR